MSNKQKKDKKKTQKEMNLENLRSGVTIIKQHSLFGTCLCSYLQENGRNMGNKAMAMVSSTGEIMLNETISINPKQWAYVIAHCMLHLAFGHFDAEKMPGYTITDEKGNKIKKTEYDISTWNMACDLYVDQFLSDIKFGQSIHEKTDTILPAGLDDEQKIYQYLIENGINGNGNTFGTAAIGMLDMKGLNSPITYDSSKNEYNRYANRFRYALAHSVSKAVSIAGGQKSFNDTNMTVGKTAAKWFVDHYPLLGGLAAHFKIIEETDFCIRNDIQIAAIDVTCGELYLNPAAGLSNEEWKFVLAHEYLHAGLMHHERCNGRNSYLWNIACDFVINGWLNELQIGVMPSEGLLYDPQLKGLSAESIYDTLLENVRSFSKFNTFRGYHKGDIIGGSEGKHPNSTSLDDFCHNALQQGLDFHVSSGRGLIPAGLIEEIRALSMPPIPWDAALAKWFDIYFAPLEKHRSYSRPSRRQSCTPDIPRPRYCPADILTESRTFGVVIDTSGSMDAKSIGKALGSIASYAVAHEVPFVRVVFCDAAAYDIGYVSPEDIAGRVQVKGRGGTKLQPAIHLLEHAKDFPKDGPILIITDGEIENHLDIRHEHAYLLPQGKRLPFRGKGKCFISINNFHTPQLLYLSCMWSHFF